MKKLFYFLAISFVILLSNKNSFADGFNSVHTSDGIYVIAVGDQGRIFRSENGGNTWSAYTEPSENFKCVYTLGNDVWLSVDNGKIFKSSKTTTVLTPYNTGVNTSINSVYFVNANIGFACGDNGTVFKSVDGGVTWNPSNTGVSAVKLNSISFKDASNGIVVGDNGKVYITVNGGTSWATETVSTTRNILDVKYFNDGIVFVGEWGTLFTKIGAAPWTAIDTRIRTDIRGVTGPNTTDVHVCGGGGFIRGNGNHSDNYANFEKNPMLANLVDIEYFGAKGFAISSMNNAVIRTTDGGTTWTLPPGTTMNISWQSKPGASGGSLGDNLCVHPTNRNTIFTCFTNRAYVSRDRGETWSQVGNTISGGNTPHSFFVSALDTNVWLCAIEASGGDRITRTTDYGQTWNTILTMQFSNYGEPLEMDQNTAGTFYFAPENGGFYRSTDNGATFTNIFGSITGTGGSFRSPCDLIVTYDSPNTIFLADGITSNGVADLFKSVDGGVNWTKKFSNPSSSEIPSICNTIFDNKIAFITNWSGTSIFKTTNTGENWSLNNTNNFSGWGSDICKEDPNFIMTGSWSMASTSMSTDGGTTWITTAGLSGAGGVMRLVERGFVIAQAGSSVYKLNVNYSVITSVSESNVSSVPDNFNLSQNYPNPFNPTTKITYALPKSGSVVLKVYNELGKEVSTLVDAFRNAGTYEITFDAASLSSGIYFYKLQSEGLVNTKKMLLVK